MGAVHSAPGGPGTDRDAKPLVTVSCEPHWSSMAGATGSLVASSDASSDSVPGMVDSGSDSDSVADGGGAGGAAAALLLRGAAAAQAVVVAGRLAAAAAASTAPAMASSSAAAGGSPPASYTWELSSSDIPPAPARTPGGAVAVASPAFLVPPPPPLGQQRSAAPSDAITTAWRLLLILDPGLSAPAAPTNPAPGRTDTTPAGGPCLSATLLLERLPIESVNPQGAAVGGGAAAAAAACQVAVSVRLPGQQQQGGSAAAAVSPVRVAVVDDVFPPPQALVAAGAHHAVGGSTRTSEQAYPRRAIGKVQIPIHLLQAATAPLPTAPPGASAAPSGDGDGVSSGSRPAAGQLGLLSGIRATRARREERDAAADGGGAAAAGASVPAGRAAGGQLMVQPAAGTAEGASGGSGALASISVAFHSLDLVPPAPVTPDPLLPSRLPPSLAPPRLPPAATAPAGGGPRPLTVLQLSSRPRLLVVDGFWGPEMCAAVAAAAAPRLARSRVATGSETPSRTSWSHFFVREAADAPLIRAAEASVEALFAAPAVLGTRRRLVKTEALQVVKYHKGEFYDQHYDNRSGAPLSRSATAIIYLCDTQSGGATYFPQAALSRSFVGGGGASTTAAGASRSSGEPAERRLVLPEGIEVDRGGTGIRVFPRLGRAVLFWSQRPDGSEDAASIHSAEKVEEGEKWIATRWMREAGSG